MAQQSDPHDKPASPRSLDSPDLKASKDTLPQNAPVKELGVPIESLRIHNRKWWQRKTINVDPGSIATQPSVFDDPKTLEIYRPPAAYENAHRFDPGARWTWGEEKALVHKVDWRIMLWATIMFFCLDLDRSNI
ncbi:hypothetical protein FRC07_003106, partial [Ceratobasidium sp. 392]